jgi:hypothetical protein
MKRPRRILLNGLTVLSLLLAIAAAGLWVRSGFVGDAFERRESVVRVVPSGPVLTHRAFGFGVSRGRFWYTGREFYEEIVATDEAIRRVRADHESSRRWRCEREYGGRRSESVWNRLIPSSWSPFSQHSGDHHGFAGFSIPLYVPLLTGLLLPTWRGLLVGRKWNAMQLGRCPACGYDMRANPARCSECGHVPAKST